MIAKFQPLASSYTVPKKHRPSTAARFSLYVAIRDNFTITTWLALGAVVQGLASLLLPARHALLPVISLLLYRSVRSIMMFTGVIPNSQMDGVVMGKYTAQIPAKDGSLSTEPAEEDIVVILLGARTNHALGLLGQGYREIGDHMNGMLADLWKNEEKYGFLGQTSWISSDERHTNNQVMVLCYFRSIEGLHAYAHGPLHRKAWDWWNSITKAHPYLSIMHEVYHAPKGHWENIYINNHVTGIANTPAVAIVNGRPARPLLEAGRGGLRTQWGRMGRGDGTDHDKYGPSPYE